MLDKRFRKSKHKFKLEFGVQVSRRSALRVRDFAKGFQGRSLYMRRLIQTLTLRGLLPTRIQKQEREQGASNSSVFQWSNHKDAQSKLPSGL